MARDPMTQPTAGVAETEIGALTDLARHQNRVRHGVGVEAENMADPIEAGRVLTTFLDPFAGQFAWRPRLCGRTSLARWPLRLERSAVQHHTPEGMFWTPPRLLLELRGKHYFGLCKATRDCSGRWTPKTHRLRDDRHDASFQAGSTRRSTSPRAISACIDTVRWKGIFRNLRYQAQSIADITLDDSTHAHRLAPRRPHCS